MIKEKLILFDKTEDDTDMRVCVNWIRLGVATPGCSDQWNLAVFSPLQGDCTRLRWSVGLSVCQSNILIS